MSLLVSRRTEIVFLTMSHSTAGESRGLCASVRKLVAGVASQSALKAGDGQGYGVHLLMEVLATFIR